MMMMLEEVEEEEVVVVMVMVMYLLIMMMAVAKMRMKDANGPRQSQASGFNSHKRVIARRNRQEKKAFGWKI